MAVEQDRCTTGPVGVVDRPVLWSHRCGWDELAAPGVDLHDVRGAVDVGRGWTSRWTAVWRYAGDEVVCPVRALDSMPVAGCEPVRRFSWRRGQRHRPGLQFLVSTGRHHGFESLAEALVLLALDFAGDLVDVLAQPLRLRYWTPDGPREHVPDVLAYTRTGRWLIDVRPAARVAAADRVAFAATAEVAVLLGWRYTVVTGWQPHVMSTLDAMSAQRRPLTDRLGLAEALSAAVADGPRPFGELAASTVAPAVARAWLLHLLWHRRLGVQLGAPLGDATLVYTGPR
ncbi:TnsA-like heteromeric transposase endonuclease subunit [Phytohabitans sp. ZYX-F-186]|uniref:TnsA-like heteromeric transposase endonuclease subunit n=1 Tax=Phytohabitans maris TaxID=3071409 RepID=A0ABU0ZMG9_9ACTN|nr:TnsA-like heteromeric transposase endonuclease subunit [Phytohabitans sp. ZYX-F-186]MDQ7907607.1 TnsA-like heteromeric transposase endonuclease subunit [Phytohabitans sp. ZYX-F-186]